MWHLYAQKNMVGWRQWKAVLQQKAMLFSTEKWYNPNIHLEKEVKHCFVFMLQYPSLFLFLFSIFTWQKFLLTIVWPIHSDTQLLGEQSHKLPPYSEQPAPCSAFQTDPPAQGLPPLSQQPASPPGHRWLLQIWLRAKKQKHRRRESQNGLGQTGP